MQTLTTHDLATISGGKNGEISTALASIQSSIKDVASQRNSGGFDSTTMLMLGLMMSQRNQGPTVVAAGAAPAASAPVVNISTRARW
jgi:bacteriocin-like protein